MSHINTQLDPSFIGFIDDQSWSSQLNYITIGFIILSHHGYDWFFPYFNQPSCFLPNQFVIFVHTNLLTNWDLILPRSPNIYISLYCRRYTIPILQNDLLMSSPCSKIPSCGRSWVGTMDQDTLPARTSGSGQALGDSHAILGELFNKYPLVNYRTMENHHFSSGKLTITRHFPYVC